MANERMAQVCLIHGQDVEAMNKVHDRTLNSLIPSEMRDENLTELITASNKALKLEDIGWDVVSELSTLSFFEDARRVVTITDLQDLCGIPGRQAASASPKSGSKKAKVTKAFCDFLTEGLLQTPNAIIFLNYEKDMNTQVLKTSALYKAIKKAGWVQECRGENKTFAFEDALRSKQAEKALLLYRDLRKIAPPNMIFNTLNRITRSLLQAKIVSIQRRKKMRDADLKQLFPDDRTGFFGMHEFVQTKNLEGAHLFDVPELVGALRELLEINRLVVPVSTDVYVRDLPQSIELWILRWFSRKPVGSGWRPPQWG